VEIGLVKARLREQRVEIELDASAKTLLVEQGFDPMYGARPLKRAIQRLLEDPLAEAVIAKRLKPGAALTVVRKGEALEFEEKVPAAAAPQ
jgi:ATP-dependent Clp protease ATP-binding subunit ClpA